jgi:hypothetical protein
MAGIELPYRAIRNNIAEALDLLTHIERRDGQRFVTEIFAIRFPVEVEDALRFEPIGNSP